MQLARVIGTVVATVKNESLSGRTLLVIQSLNKDLEAQGKPLVAVDSVGAGVGELVFWCRGKEASFPFKREDTPTDCTIVGIVDSDAHVFNGSSSNQQSAVSNQRSAFSPK
jgi:ethanolamine utilization protein EutN